MLVLVLVLVLVLENPFDQGAVVLGTLRQLDLLLLSVAIAILACLGNR